MARAPSGDRMRAFSQSSTFISPTHHLHAIPTSPVAVNASSFGGEPLTTHLHIPQSSSSAGNHFSLPPTSGVTVIDTRAVRANQKVLSPTISVILPSLNNTLGSVPYDHGTSVPVNLSSSQSRSWLMVPLCSNVYPYRLFDHRASSAVELRFGFPLQQTKPNYQPQAECPPIPPRTTAFTLAATTTM